MTEDPVWVDAHATMGEAVRRMFDTGVHHLPVLNDGVVVGIVSERDVRAAFPLLPPLEEQLEAWTKRLDEPIEQSMTRQVFSVTPDSDLTEAIDLMVAHHVGAIPVIDDGAGKLVGIVSYVDVLRQLRASLWG
jgi:acetoin utilization protein AcuB